MDQIYKKDITEMFQVFLEAEQIEQDSRKQLAVRSAISDALRMRKPDPAFLEKLQQFIENPASPEFERGLVLGILSSAGTHETERLLLHEARSLKDPKMRETAIEMVQNIPREEENEDLTPDLNQAWLEATDPKMMNSVAMAMGGTGAPSSIELLLKAALAPDGKDDARREAAMQWGLGRVWTENAVPPLAALLEKSPVGTTANLLAFNLLSGISGEKATQVVMKWLQSTDQDAATMAKAWFDHIRDEQTQVTGAEAAISPKAIFRNEGNRKALREGLEAYRANRAVIRRR